MTIILYIVLPNRQQPCFKVQGTKHIILNTCNILNTWIVLSDSTTIVITIDGNFNIMITIISPQDNYQGQLLIVYCVAM